MANALYNKGKEGLLGGDIAWDSDSIKVALVNVSYTANLSSHTYLSDVGIANVVATSPALAGKTITNGVADADDVVFAAVSGAAVTQLVVFKDTGATASSRLIAHIDTGTNVSFTPDGTAVTIQWSAAASKIFAL